MVTASAPGKVYLFGEHAVVYGEPAVPCAVERRATVTVEERPDDRLRVEASDLSLDGFTVEYAGDTAATPDLDAPSSLVEAALGYVETAVEQARDAASRPDAGFDVTVESDIPLGAGLGSSAAVVVALLAAATEELGHPLDRRALADRAYRVEHAVQDGQASRADTFCSTMGGAVRVEGDDCASLDAPALPFVVGYDGGAGDTGELVAGVRDLKERYDFAADTVAAIGDVVRRGESVLAEASGDGDDAGTDSSGDGGEADSRGDGGRDEPADDAGADSRGDGGRGEPADSDEAAPADEVLAELGRLMDFDHGLLSALGVSARSLDAMAWAAREAGAHGAKLTGAGGGGCVVALDATGATETALSYAPECEEVFRASLDADGVRVEDA